MTIHTFESTGEAYDACQCDDRIKNGDTLLIPSEGVVGIADTWPVAVTLAYGDLHTPADGVMIRDCLPDHCSDAAITEALLAAGARGYPIHD